MNVHTVTNLLSLLTISLEGAGAVLDRLREMESRGAWSEIRALAPSLLEGVVGAERAKVCSRLAVAFAYTSTCGDDWRTALHYAKECHRLSAGNEILRAWSNLGIATIAVNMGRLREAKVHTNAFITQSKHLPSLAHYRPSAWMTLGVVAYQSGRYKEAATNWRRAHTGFVAIGDEIEACRTAEKLVWAHCRLRQPEAARPYYDMLRVSDERVKSGASAILAFATGDWEGVIENGTSALNSKTSYCDYVGNAEIALLMSRANVRLEQSGRQRTLERLAHEYALRQDRALGSLLVLSLRVKGGDSPYDSANRGSGGFHPDACYTTGVA